MSDDLEQAFRRRKIDILHLCATRAEILASKNARRHLMEGFYRRLGILETNRINIREIADPNRTKNLNPYECGDLNLHLNSYYFQMRGSLDNLAWIVHYELALLGTGDEGDPPTRMHCNLFGRNFLKALNKQRPSLKDALSDKRQWERDFKELRDPVAHRIPLYAPPGVINSENEVERFKELEREGTAAALGGIFEEYKDKRQEASQVGRYSPLFTCSGPSGLEVRSIPQQVNLDQENFLYVCEVVLFETLGQK